VKIKDLPKDENLRGVKFKVPKDHPECPLKTAYWYSQWGYIDGKAGIWCKENMEDEKVYPIFLDKLDEVLEFDVINPRRLK